jgi:predicted NBD/HSP70 family sugar kinase
MQHYVGLDVSLSETAICVVDQDGIVIREGRAASEPEAITAWLAELDIAVTRVGLEIGGLARSFIPSCAQPVGQQSALTPDA